MQVALFQVRPLVCLVHCTGQATALQAFPSHIGRSRVRNQHAKEVLSHQAVAPPSNEVSGVATGGGRKVLQVPQQLSRPHPCPIYPLPAPPRNIPSLSPEHHLPFSPTLWWNTYLLRQDTVPARWQTFPLVPLKQCQERYTDFYNTQCWHL